LNGHRINNEIRAPEVRVIDDQGQNLGIMALDQALALARERGLDLIEIAPQANPPVAKIMSFGKYKYTQQREARKTKTRRDVVKTVRITFGAGLHDLEIRARQAEEFLAEGNRVQIEMRLRGREKGKRDLAYLKLLPLEVKILNERKTPNGFLVLVGKAK